MGRKSVVPTKKIRITLTEKGLECLKSIRKAGRFRSDSSTIEESLIFIQQLRDIPGFPTLVVLGKRFGINVADK